MSENRYVSFTGHRDADPETALPLLEDTVEDLINHGAETFVAGGAAGFDTLAAETVLRIRENYPWVSLVMVLPCPPEEQSRSFTAEMKQRYSAILASADRTECIAAHYYNGCMKARNQRLVDLADICVCWYDEAEHASSGTGQTVRMAQKKGITVINLFKG
ncbi:MAG: DUF1273 family protein [Ruminiclostridium sp.]|nr:DUF1273 family protein [Ruminiclostridium sp.]